MSLKEANILVLSLSAVLSNSVAREGEKGQPEAKSGMPLVSDTPEKI